MIAHENIARNYLAIKKRIAASCERAGRNIDDIELIAVTKRQSIESIEKLNDLGQINFGESRIQEANEKVLQFESESNWHLIGHLQTNKAKLAVKLFDTIHSVDSERLLFALDPSAKNIDKVIKIFLQVNISGEESKFGLVPEDVEALLTKAIDLENIQVQGLMTMAPFSEDESITRSTFSGLKNLRDDLIKKGFSDVNALSMGMSNDFEIAIEEGATHVRVGTALFID